MREAVSDSDNVHGTLIVDAGGVIRYCSAALARILRRRPDELLGAAIRSVLHDYALPVTVAQKETPSQAACLPETQPTKLQLATADGRRIPVNVLACTLPCEPSSLVVLDVWTSGGKLEDQPELQRLAWSVERSSDAVVITDADAVIEYVNPAFESISGFAGAEALGKTPAILKSGHHTQDFYRELWETLRSGAEFRGVLVNRKKSGELFYEEKVIRPFFGPSGRITHFVSIGRDSTDRIRAMERLTYAATHDNLTALPNRQLFFDRLGQALRQATRRASGLAVAVVDVDRFKEINDALGHLAGDAVLKAVGIQARAQRARSRHRSPPGGRRVRPGPARRRRAWHAGAGARQDRTRFRAPAAVAERSIRVSISIGACLYPAAGGSEHDLMQCADKAHVPRQARRGRPLLHRARPRHGGQVSDAASHPRPAYWSRAAGTLIAELGTTEQGLGNAEAQTRLARAARNALPADSAAAPARLLLRQFASPLVLILVFGAALSIALGEWVDASIILGIVLGSTLLGFSQEYRASLAVSELRRRLALTARVRRDAALQTIPASHVVPGDVVLLSAGNLVPADGVVLEARDFLVTEAALTGESFPVEKHLGVVPADAPIAASDELGLPRHLGAQWHRHGAGRAHRPRHGVRCRRAAPGGAPPETEFERGVRQFGYLLVRVMVVMVLFVLDGNQLLRPSGYRVAAVRGRARGRPFAGAPSCHRQRDAVRGRTCHGAARSHRPPPGSDREPGQHGCAVHRQDRHPHRGCGHAERGAVSRRRSLATRCCRLAYLTRPSRPGSTIRSTRPSWRPATHEGLSTHG